MKALIQSFHDVTQANYPQISMRVGFFDASSVIEVTDLAMDLSGVASGDDFQGVVTQRILDYPSEKRYLLTSDDIIGAFSTHADLAAQVTKIDALTATVDSVQAAMPAKI